MPTPQFYNDSDYFSFWFGREFDLPNGASAWHDPDNPVNSQEIPYVGYLQQLTINSTVKIDGIQTLAAIVVAGKALWAGEQYKGTVSVVVPIRKPLAVNNNRIFLWLDGLSTLTGAPKNAYEIQVTGIVTSAP